MYNFHVDNIELQLSSFHSLWMRWTARNSYFSFVFHFQNENEIENKIGSEIKHKSEMRLKPKQKMYEIENESQSTKNEKST